MEREPRPSELTGTPHFIIIGAQKCGTTSLYNYLVQHPQVIPPHTFKEIHFFDLNFHQGIDWYRSQFHPLADGQDFLTGEATPYYLFHPLVPGRLFDNFPQTKLIVLLRNPVMRAISHYYHEVKLGFEKLPLDAAILAEENRLEGEIEKIKYEENYYSFNHQHFTYLSRGIYLEQLKHWFSFFPREQFLILKSELFYQHPDLFFNQVLEFLELSPYHLPAYENYGAGDYPEVAPEIKEKLQDFFQPHNQALSEYLQQDFNW